MVGGIMEEATEKRRGKGRQQVKSLTFIPYFFLFNNRHSPI